MRHEIGTQVCQHFLIEDIPLLRQLMKNPRLCMDIVKDHTIRDEVVVLDAFALCLPIVRGNHPLTPTEEPLHKAVEGLTFIGGGMNRLAELCIAEIAQEERRPDYAP
jgi:hypothetical protein